MLCILYVYKHFLCLSKLLKIFPDEGHDISSKHYMLSSVISFFRECFHENTAVTVETEEED